MFFASHPHAPVLPRTDDHRSVPPGRSTSGQAEGVSVETPVPQTRPPRHLHRVLPLHPATGRHRRPRRGNRPTGSGSSVRRRHRSPGEGTVGRGQGHTGLRVRQAVPRPARRAAAPRPTPPRRRRPRNSVWAPRRSSSSVTSSRTATAPCTPATSAPTTDSPSSAATWWSTPPSRAPRRASRKASRATHQGGVTDPDGRRREAPRSRRWARRRRRRPKSPDVNKAPRKVIWAASGTPRPRLRDGRRRPPARRHPARAARHHGRHLRREALRVAGDRDRHRQHGCTAARSPSAPRSPGSTYNLTDGARGSHKTYNLNRGTSGTGTLFSGPDDVWGNGTASNLETAGADAALRRRTDLGLLQERARPLRHQGRRRRRVLARPLRQQLRQRLLVRTAASA